MPSRSQRRIEQIVRPFPENGLKVLLQDPANVSDLLHILNFRQADRLDFTKMKTQSATFIPRDFRHVESDLLLTVPFRMGPTKFGKTVTIYILIEHQSEPDSLMNFRILDYVVQILRVQLRNLKRKQVRSAAVRFQPVVPIVFYTGLRAWSEIADLETLFEAGEVFRDVLPKIKPLFLNISFLDHEALEHSGRLFGWILRLLQERETDDRAFEAIIQDILRAGVACPEREIERWKEVLTYLSAFVYHYRKATEQERLTAQIESAAAIRGLQEGIQIVKLTMAEVHRREGLQKGRQEMQIQAKREVVLVLLKERFGELSQEITDRINAETDVSVLDQWFKQGISARNLKQVGIS